MRSTYRIALAVLAAALALSAVTASSAFAAPEWYSQTSSGLHKLTSSLAVKATTTKLTIGDSGFWAPGTGVKLSCEGAIKGAIEAGGAGKIESFALSSCKILEGPCGSATGAAVNLPWKTELYSEGGAVRERLVSGGSGTPGYKFTCEGTEVDTCNLNTSANMENVESLGSVNAIFEEKSNRTSCTRGGSKGGQMEGTIGFARPEGLEAIKALEVVPSEWRQGGTALTEAVATTWKGTVRLTDKHAHVALECEDSGEGSAGPGAADTETQWTASKCATKEGTCPRPSLTAAHLSWDTELIAYGGVVHDLTFSGGSGAPGYNIVCLGVVEETCSGMLNSTMENVTGGVDAAFDVSDLSCTFGGKEGTLTGTQLIEATKGGKLEVK